MACGIENCVLPSKKFRIELENEIERVLAFGGVFLSWLSCMRPKELHMRKISDAFYVFSKEAPNG